MTNEEFITRYRNGEEEASFELWQRLQSAIKKIAFRYPADVREDLIQESYFSLLKAIENFKEGEYFAPYFVRVCKTDFTRYVLKQGIRPEYIEYIERNVTRYEAEFLDNNDRKPNDAEIKRALNITQSQLDSARSPKEAKSLDEPLNDEGFTIGETLPASVDIEGDYLEQEEKEIIWEEVEKCKHPEIIRQTFIDNKTVKEIAEHEGLTDSQVITRRKSDLSQLRRNRLIKEIFALNFKHVGGRQFQRTHTSEEELFILQMEEAGMLR